MDIVVATVDAALQRHGATTTENNNSNNDSKISSGSNSSGSGSGESGRQLEQATIMTTRSLERWKQEMPTEGEMLPRDKYSMFDRKEKGYRKGVHSE